MRARSLLPAFALFALACNKHEGDIPLHVTNAPVADFLGTPAVDPLTALAG